MRILLLTQLFQPEPNHLKGLTFAKSLVELGHEVEVLTGFPNYPSGRIYDGYRNQLYMREWLEGVPVNRVAVYPSHDNSGFRRFMCYASLAISTSLALPLLIRRPDVVHVYQGPATLALAAEIGRTFCGVPFVLDIQDIWPESVTGSGMLTIPGGVALLDLWCSFTYRAASKIIVLSKGYKKVLVEKGVPADKIEVVYNWCDESQMLAAEMNTDIDQRFGLSGHFNVVFAGTMGKLQALDAVVRAAAMLQHESSQVQFVFIGAGIDVERLKRVVASSGVGNVRFIPRQPLNKIGSFLECADALLVHLRDDPLGRIGIPQKMQAYMASGKPILMAVRGEAAEIVRSAGAGVVCEPENPESIASAVRELLAMSPEDRAVLGMNGRQFYQRALSLCIGVRRMEKILQEVVTTHSRR